MKRILVRISALATVVLLGGIAIGQAQRGIDDGEAAMASDAAPQPILAPADARMLPRGTTANPLRTVDRASPASRVIPTAGTSPAEPSASSAVSTSTPGISAPPARTADPFGFRGRAGKAAAGSAEVGSYRTDRSAVPTEVVGGTQPPTAETQPPPAEPKRYGEPARSPIGKRNEAQPLAGSQPTVAPDLPAISAAPATSEISDRTVGDAPALGEPAPFKLDRATGASTMPPIGAANVFSASPRAGVSASNELAAVQPDSLGQGTGQPGSAQLEGIQSPQLSIQKFAPGEIQVGKPAVFQVKVKNTGQTVAHGVEIRDQIPKGTQLIGTTPRASRGAGGELVWVLGTMKPGDEVSVETKLMPIAEGEVGSVATVHFRADASARTIATKPQLVIKVSSPRQVLIGEQVALSITISNPGSGIATGVILSEHVPPELQHSAGPQLEYEIGDLKPDESRQLDLVLTAARAGSVVNVLTARGDGNLRTEERQELEVTAPRLDIALAGPKRRFLEREATYTVTLSNPGSAPARQVELVAHLPVGLKFVSANNAGQYEDATRSIHWLLEELPTNETGSVQLTTMPIEAGQQKLRFSGTAEKGLSVEKEQPVLIEGIAAILFEVVDVSDPIEVGGETTYEIRVLNQGSKAASNVRLAVLLPAEMRAVAAEGPTRHAINGTQVLFDGLSRLAPKADTTYRVRVQGLQPGDQRVRVQLLTDDMRTPVTKEESTQVYSDE